MHPIGVDARRLAVGRSTRRRAVERGGIAGGGGVVRGGIEGGKARAVAGVSAMAFVELSKAARRLGRLEDLRVRFADILRFALGALFQQKVRTFLTTLGVILATFVLAASVAIGLGVRHKVISS